MRVLIISQDAQGRAMYDYFKGKQVSEIIERDDGYIDVDFGPKVYFTDYKDWAKHVQRAMKYVKGRVLDIGCGAGRHSLYLQNKGFDVLGIDVSPYAIKVSKLRGLKNSRIMSVTQLSSKLGKFDTILMLGNNFGLFENPKHGKWLLNKFINITNDKAIIIAQTLNPYRTREPHHTNYHKQNRIKGKLGGEVKIRARYQNIKSPWFNYWLASKPEVKELVYDTRWQIKRFVDSKGPIYIAILEKCLK
jgi:SAM-dependent methyltransferase